MKKYILTITITMICIGTIYSMPQKSKTPMIKTEKADHIKKSENVYDVVSVLFDGIGQTIEYCKEELAKIMHFHSHAKALVSYHTPKTKAHTAAKKLYESTNRAIQEIQSKIESLSKQTHALSAHVDTILEKSTSQLKTIQDNHKQAKKEF